MKKNILLFGLLFSITPLLKAQVGGISASYKLAKDSTLGNLSSYVTQAQKKTDSLLFEPTLTKGNLTASLPVSLSATRQVIGGAAVISVDTSTAITGLTTLYQNSLKANKSITFSAGIAISPTGLGDLSASRTINADTTFYATSILSGFLKYLDRVNYESAYSQRLQWDGGATNLVASTGRTSLGLGSIAVLDSSRLVWSRNATVPQSGTLTPATNTDTLFVNYPKFTGYAALTSAIGTAADLWIRRVNPGRLVFGTTATDSGAVLSFGRARGDTGTVSIPAFVSQKADGSGMYFLPLAGTYVPTFSVDGNAQGRFGGAVASMAVVSLMGLTSAIGSTEDVIFRRGASAGRLIIGSNASDSLATVTFGTLNLTAGPISATTTVRDTAAFVTTETRTAVYIAGATSTNQYVASPRVVDAEILPTSNDLILVYAKADSVIFTRPASGTSGLKFSFIRIK